MSAHLEVKWFAVRCLFLVADPSPEDDGTYEERITIWRASSVEEAVEQASIESRAYAASTGDQPLRYLDLAQAYRLDGDVSEGAEIFSMMRDSPLDPESYLSAFYDTGAERQENL
jgi:hypothetical protein